MTRIMIWTVKRAKMSYQLTSDHSVCLETAQWQSRWSTVRRDPQTVFHQNGARFEELRTFFDVASKNENMTISLFTPLK